jgi:TolB-like protein/Tfp pilus assembly protein PilF
MLAVLPLENLTGDPAQDYFADGLTEEIITEMGRLFADRMGVIARTSVMRYKSKRTSVRRIARELGVGYVLEGSIRRVDSRVRVAAQLIETSGQTHIWAQAYERPIGDIFAVQSAIAQAVAEKVGIQLGSFRRGLRQSANPEAYDCYLKGRFEWYKLSREHFDIALQYFQFAAERDPDCALAHAGIADVWWIRGDNGIIPACEAYPAAQAALSRALHLDDSLADVRVILANCKFAYEWDWIGAEIEFQRALELNPNSAHAHFMYADFLTSMRRFEQAAREMDRVLELDPFNYFFRCFLGWHLLYRRRDDDAIALLRKTLRAEPRLAATHLALWGAFHRKGMETEALAEARAFYDVLGDGEVVETLWPGATCDYAQAMRTAADKLAARSIRTFVPAIRIARLYAQAGVNANALHWLEKAYDDREPPLVHLTVGWDWDNLQNEASFQRLLNGMNLA